jgi:Ca2+-binding RTX toxin-like protein
MRSARLAVLVGAALIASALAPGSAAATVTCQFDGGSKTLEVFENTATAIVRSGSNIQVLDPTDVVACAPGGATVNNTDTILIADSGSGGYLNTIDFSGGPFAPGADDEGGTSDEIEFSLQSVELVNLKGTGGIDHFRFGTEGGSPVANFNAGAESGGILTPGVDDDADLFGTESVQVSAGGSNDVLRGDGGVGTGTAFQRTLSLFGGVGDDQLTGGEADDRIGYLGLSSDEAGNDILNGGAGADRISAAPGDDQITGGAGADAATYFNAPSGLTIDLAASGQQNTGGGGLDTFSQVEGVSGSAFDDTLLGDAAANVLTGGAGNDLIDGRAGEDELQGDDSVNSGSDTVVVRDGGHDKATCGPESDTVVADLAGVDTIDPDCENVDFATFTPPPPPDGGGSDTAVDVVLAAKKKQDAVKQKGLVVRASCPDENCDVTTSGSIRLPRERGTTARAKARLVKLRAVSDSLPAGVTEPLGLRLPKKGARRTSAALEDRRRLPAVVRISATDLAGNRDTAKVKVKVID